MVPLKPNLRGLTSVPTWCWWRRLVEVTVSCHWRQLCPRVCGPVAGRHRRTAPDVGRARRLRGLTRFRFFPPSLQRSPTHSAPRPLLLRGSCGMCSAHRSTPFCLVFCHPDNVGDLLPRVSFFYLILIRLVAFIVQPRVSSDSIN